jgi:hypothetical protein
VLPAWTAGLALEDATLVTEGEDFSAEARVGVASSDHEFEDEADDGAGQGAEHDLRAWQKRRARGLVRVAAR